MAVITPEIKEFIKNNLGWITTVSKDGELDLGEFGRIHFIDWDQKRMIATRNIFF